MEKGEKEKRKLSEPWSWVPFAPFLAVCTKNAVHAAFLAPLYCTFLPASIGTVLFCFFFFFFLLFYESCSSGLTCLLSSLICLFISPSVEWNWESLKKSSLEKAFSSPCLNLTSGLKTSIAADGAFDGEARRAVAAVVKAQRLRCRASQCNVLHLQCNKFNNAINSMQFNKFNAI